MTFETAQKFGCKFLPVPEISLAPNHTLPEIFCADDVTHANEAFGEIMLEHLIEFENCNDR